MSAAVLAREPRPATRSQTVRQPQIQALRAIAVSSVIVFHYWPGLLPGGYAGVDVFFVISGYLMTSSVMHLRADGTRGLGGVLREFYVRRLTRILPAAVVTLLACAIGSLVLVPLILWPETLREILASAFFVENWALVADAANYLRGGGSSPVQHFWSLSVEEQFYAVWPLVVVFAATAGPRVTARGRMVKLVAVFGVLTGASLLYSIHLTASDPAAAYFSTLTRFWELSFGAVVLVLDRHVVGRAAWRAAAGWLGLALIGWTLVTYTQGTPFPSWRAGLPLLGTALVLVSSPASARWGPVRILSWRPAQRVGDLSYSLYLLHWPVLVLATRAVGVPSPSVRLLLVLVVVVAALLMKHQVEDRFRLTGPTTGPGGGTRTRRPASLRRSVMLVCTVQVIVVVVAGGGLLHHRQLVSAAAEAARPFTSSPQRQATCFAAVSDRRTSPACPATPDSVLSVLPSPLVARADWPYDRCQQRGDADQRCDLLHGSSGRVVIAGDSHIVQWIPAILPWAARHDLSVTTFVKSGCVLTDTTHWGLSCARWNSKVWGDIEALRPDYVMTSALSGFNDEEVTDKAMSVITRWRQITALGAHLVLFRDIPQPKTAGILDMAACIIDHGPTAACSFDRRVGLSRDFVKPAADLVGGSTLIDLAPYFCPDRVCRPVQQGILVYIDSGHMSSWWAKALAGVVGRRLDRIGPG